MHRQQKYQLNALATIRVDIGVDIAQKNFLATPTTGQSRSAQPRGARVPTVP
jgi:hypothetical protein